MGYMFSNCRSLISLDLSNFNTQKVSSMNYMFSGCSSLIYIDISGFTPEFNILEGYTQSESCTVKINKETVKENIQTSCNIVIKDD